MNRIANRECLPLAATLVIILAIFGCSSDPKSAEQRKSASTDEAAGSKEKTSGRRSADSPAEVLTNAAGPRVFPRGQKLVFWWDPMSRETMDSTLPAGPGSNIHPADYAGPDACKECHQQNHNDWANHPHRWMNAQANDNTVKGSFTEQDEIRYLGGRATFRKQGDRYLMDLERDSVRMSYEIDQTLGSRFFQYYIGRLIQGPYEPKHPYRTVRHVLPFGYWLQRKQWVPVVHVGPELPDGYRTDPFNMPQVPEEGKSFLPYAKYCNMCHSTFATGDNLFRKPFTLERHFPGEMHVDMAEYIRNIHPELWGENMSRESASRDQIFRIPAAMTRYDAEDHAVSFGISCEACHFGCQEHVADPKKLPSFAPLSEYLRVKKESGQVDTGRTHENLNWTCGKCHTGDRPLYAGQMSTWNSTEYTDAMKGSCYSQLNCVNCHQPHKATGHKWSRTPEQDDASCIQCHKQYVSESAIVDHTHHPAGSAGSRCMNCHMPRINEGLQEVVRTHTIFSPTSRPMLENNQPNACNLCHTDKPIDWTVRYLQDWYQAEFDQARIRNQYRPGEKVGLGWLKSRQEAVRLIAIDALGRNGDRWAGAAMIDMLDDPFLINRQFSMAVIEKTFNVRLEDFGYRFYMTPAERAVPIQKLKEHLKLGP